ncbi:MAG: Ig-like domain-containing protein [Prevotella sp.]|nr:Ig-like domain-containing protein [Prevotella sp.]
MAVFSGVWAGESEVYNFAFTKQSGPSGYANTYNVTIGGYSWTIPGNLTNGDYLRIGGKSISEVDRVIQCNDALTGNISKIVFNHNGKSRANVTVHSVTLTVASDADFSDVVDEVVVSDPPVAKDTAGEIVFEPSTGVEWNGNLYYRFTVNISNSDSSNGGFDLTSIVFYTNVAGAVDPSVSFANTSETIEVGETVTNELTKPNDLTVTYSSDDTDIATVDENGVVTGVAEGEATITASWEAVTDKYNEGSVSYTVNVTAATVAVNYVKVTNMNQILAGNEYILVGTKASSTAAMGQKTGTNTYRDRVEVTVNEDKVAVKDNDGIAILTLGGSKDAWTFLASDNSEYLALTANSNALHSSTDATLTSSQWIITDDFQLENANVTGRYIQYNSGATRFACYTSGQGISTLYVKEGSPINETAPVATNITFDPMSILPGDDGMFTVGATYAEGATYNVTIESSDEDMLMLFTSGDHTGEFIAGNTEGTVTVTVTITPTGENAANFTEVTETFEVAIEDPREAIATINSFPYTEMTVNSDYPGLTADLTLADGVNEGDYEVTFETESELLMIEDDYCYVGNEAGTAVITVTVTPTDETTYKPVSRDFTITIVDPNASGTENNPYTVEEALEVIDGLNGGDSDNVYVKGIISSIERYSGGTATYWISDDGFTKDLQVYKGNYLNQNQFSGNELTVGDIVVVYGKLTLYNTTPEFKAGNYVIEHITRTPIATSITAITPTEVQTNATGSFGVTWELAEGANAEDYEMTLSTNSELITLDGFNYTTGGQTGTADITVTVTALDEETYSNVQKTFTVNIIGEPIVFVDPVIGCGLYQKVTSNDQLVAGHRYLIVYDEDATAGEGFEVFNGVSSNLGQVSSLGNETNFANHIIDARDAAVSPVVLQAGDNGNWYMQNGEEFLAYTKPVGTSSNNNLYSESSYMTNGTLWTIDTDNGTITNAYNDERLLQYNYNNGNPRFACYKNTMVNAFLYVELEEVPVLNLSETDTEQQVIESGVYPIVNFTYGVKAGWNTVAMPFEGVSILDIMSDVKVYEFTGLSDEGDLNFSEFTGNFEAGKPYVFYSESETESNEHEFANVNVIYEAGISNEYFISTLYRMSMAGLYGVVPSTGQIKKGGSNSFIKGFRGYFALPADANDAVNAIFHNEDGTTTAIKAVELLNNLNGDVYDLSGRKVNGALQPGVYVKDGKKVVVK